MSILNKTTNLELTQFGGDVGSFANIYSVYNSDMQKIDLSVSELSSSLIGVAGRVATLENTMSEVSDKADNAVDVANGAKETAEAMDGRVSTLENKVENLETWSGGVDVTLEAYDGRLDAIELVIATVSTANIEDLIRRIDALEQKVDANTQSIDTLNSNLIGAVDRIEDLETGLGSTNAELNTVKGRVTTLENCCQEVRDVLADHNNRINKNASDISELDARLTRDETNIAGNASDITILATQNNTQAEQIDDLYDKYNALDPASPSSLISRVTTLENVVGSEVLTTTAQTCTGAINELDDEVGDMNVDVANLKTVVGDSNSGLVSDVTQIQLDVSQLSSSLIGVAGRVSNVESDVTQIQLDISQLQSSVIGVNGKVGDLSQLGTTDKSSLVNAVNEVLNNITPTGMITPYGGSTAPNGWLLCDGSEVAKTDYAELYAVIGDAFGTASAGNFCLPDLRECTTKGAGLYGGTVGAHVDADGLSVGEFIDDRVQAHIHKGTTPFYIGAGGYYPYNPPTAQGSYNTNPTLENEGRKGATTEVKAIGVNYIIKY